MSIPKFHGYLSTYYLVQPVYRYYWIIPQREAEKIWENLFRPANIALDFQIIRHNELSQNRLYLPHKPFCETFFSVALFFKIIRLREYSSNKRWTIEIEISLVSSTKNHFFIRAGCSQLARSKQDRRLIGLSKGPILTGYFLPAVQIRTK